MSAKLELIDGLKEARKEFEMLPDDEKRETLEMMHRLYHALYSTVTVYTRIPVLLDRAIEDYASEKGLTKAEAIKRLLENGHPHSWDLFLTRWFVEDLPKIGEGEGTLSDGLFYAARVLLRDKKREGSSSEENAQRSC
jgi:hypothetical protein